MKIKIILIIIFIIISGIFIVETTTMSEEYPINMEIQNDRMERLLDCMSFLESGNRDHLVILDTNNKYSYGILQFQIDTIKQFSTTTDPIALALDPIKSRQLAKEMILKGYINRWYTTVQKIKNEKCPNFRADETMNYDQ